MGAITSAFGIGPGGSSGSAGSKFSAGTTNIQTPVTNDQATNAYTLAQQGINNQAAFLAALQAQNGIGNQSAVYNSLGQIANGQGPNPAQAMLNNQTGTNVANTAALIAGQRGAGANVGLLARQAAQAGAGIQQNAVGQAASLEANQALGALGQQAGIATNQVGNQAAATGAYTGATQGEQQNLLNAIGQQNNANVGMQSNINSSNSGVAQQVAGTQGQLVGGLFSGAGAGLKAATGHKGGTVVKMADGGRASPNLGVDLNIAAPASPAAPAVNYGAGPKSKAAQVLAGITAPQQASDKNAPPAYQGAKDFGTELAAAVGKGVRALKNNGQPPMELTNSKTVGAPDSGGGSAMMAARGGKVPALLSPGEIYLPPDKAKKVAEGKADAKKVGERIPGKPAVKGDSLKNDTVRKNLDVGGVVVKRTVALAKDEEKTKAFVQACLAKHGSRGMKRG